ncbi:unnamed protein product [Pleuronectes platessa]|uniref:Secreted protein n=1 Tax=Pleuronectes platessa TaxID=8262 RepID=A0A9N7V7A5_PLEPL|nr:unnamed protein product [Pleuronectes platessa]
MLRQLKLPLLPLWGCAWELGLSQPGSPGGVNQNRRGRAIAVLSFATVLPPATPRYAALATPLDSPCLLISLPGTNERRPFGSARRRPRLAAPSKHLALMPPPPLRRNNKPFSRFGSPGRPFAS